MRQVEKKDTALKVLVTQVISKCFINAEKNMSDFLDGKHPLAWTK